MLRARMRALCGWSDACILNVSSRGLMINSTTIVKGNMVELWHGEHVIVGTVVWRKGTHAGLRAEERVPVDEILALSQSSSPQLTAESWPKVDRRKKPRTDDGRVHARAIEYAGIIAVATCLAAAAFATMEQAFARPLHYVRAALN